MASVVAEIRTRYLLNKSQNCEHQALPFSQGCDNLDLTDKVLCKDVNSRRYLRKQTGKWMKLSETENDFQNLTVSEENPECNRKLFKVVCKGEVASSQSVNKKKQSLRQCKYGRSGA
jgi:hypothetical protein